ncbi:MAG: circularly permuted type 2 ATP-grasp protein, partial [Leptospiraceae bacterium]|nr:circularly permuted type 2 ATP-grasp protein [Leptospiraceae bacterium]
IPSGVSYALINRQIMREQFPTLFNQMKIRQVWDTPSVILNRLRECAPKQIENPTIVLLTPGIYNEAYTEHELLASRMGIPLVMPKDLIVKENHVFMRTVTGLAKVDIIYRRIEDYFIDPVSFYQESVLGVPGLLSCVIHGNVTVANALGCGIASSKALLPFMNKIIRYYLNEEPKLPTIETYLLSDEKTQKHIFENIEHYVIKPVHGTGGYGLSIGYELSEGQKNELQKKVSSNPYHFIAQPVIQLSTSRIFNLANLEKRYVESRFFTFLGSSFSIANCALTRVSPTSSSLVVTNSRGGGSKDTWIIGESERKAVRFLVPLTKNRSKTFLLSRVAESLFWLGRYMYRSHITSRVLQVMF